MNVLLTSVGRRSYLVDYFKQALGVRGKVVAASCEPLASGMLAADAAYVVPPVNSPDYISKLMELCDKEEISLVLSLFDIDLSFLAAAREKFEAKGISVAVADSWAIETANDKWKSFKFLKNNGIATPETFLDLETVKERIGKQELLFPLIVKPRWGMGSISVFKADDLEELEFFYHYSQKQIKKSYLKILSAEEIEKSVIVQSFVGGKEYNLDVFNSLSGAHIQTVAKEKIAMRSGETDIAKTVKNRQLEDLGAHLASLFRHRGNMDVDVLQDDYGHFFVLEMNMRFGGGYPFSHIAGVDFPKALVDMLAGQDVKPFAVNDCCVGLKEIVIIKAESNR